MTSSSLQGPLPDSVVSLLTNTNFVHLGTCLNNTPHVSLMNYTFITPTETYQKSSNDYFILLATPKDTNKYRNLTQNPVCSILVHDWTTSGKVDSSEQSGHLLKLLMGLNQNELSDLSCTLTGHVAKFLEDSEESQYYKDLHLKNNPNAKCFIEGDNVAMVLIKIDGSKVVDSNNNISQYN
ncbi:hypothetical protein CANARDRAFT_6269 [[Candida] arabinofermentans NRRL YB-2248]|uniref:Pyridoxamine 5'-phosphate oxidase N-terminal domain-containing protein n=1 Tax=[Candida] arabinofermentans NRRL YB-2248 TaxID=983967 RepID=A0A1E4T4J7_9ASCO|nr:hypothetical protein CANARDRAFT_6269 [[Candida] arabinofermentans NRRL YB-2248]